MREGRRIAARAGAGHVFNLGHGILPGYARSPGPGLVESVHAISSELYALRGGGEVPMNGHADGLAAAPRLEDGPRIPVTPELLLKYDRPGPRYTSYPTAVEFDRSYDEGAYRRSLEEAASRPDDPLSLYIHLPFCEERCTFCGCNVIITRSARWSRSI